MDATIEISNENIFIKKIYINDFILNKKFVDTSLKDVIKNVLVNKFNNNVHINNKVNNIVNKVTKIYKEENNNKVFNLSYQPFNEEKMKYDYLNNNYTKKWIIPVVNEKKTLCINELSLDKFYQLSKINECINIDLNDVESKVLNFTDKCYKLENNIYYGSYNLNSTTGEKLVTPKIMYNNLIDESLISYKKINLSEAPFNNKEFDILENIQMYNEINADINIPNNDMKVLKICKEDNECYYADSKQIKNSKEGIKIIPELMPGKYEMHNTLKSENINITDYLVINPETIINTNYNIYLGNKISYLDEIINTKELNIDSYFNSNKLDEADFNYKIINKVDFYSLTDYNYLNILKRNTFDNCYSIRDIKYIYNLYDLDLNNIPECYIEFLRNTLDNNIRNYSIKNTQIPINLLMLYDSYNFNINTNTDNLKLLDIYDEKFLNNKYDTFDYGGLYDYSLYLEYLNNLDNKVIQEKKPVLPVRTDEYKNMKITKTYNNLNLYENDILKNNIFNIDKADLYLIEYNDLINNLHKPKEEYNFNHKIISTSDINKKKFTENDIDNIKDEIYDLLSNKEFIYTLIYRLNTDDDILYHKINHYKYKYKFHVIIPKNKITNDNLIIINKSVYKYIGSTNSIELLEENIENLDNKLKTIDSSLNYHIENNSIENKASIISNLEEKNINDLNQYIDDVINVDTDYEEQKNKINNIINQKQYEKSYYNHLLNKNNIEEEEILDISDLPKLQYMLLTNTTNDDISNNLIRYLLNYNSKKIKKTVTKRKEDIIKNIDNSKYNTIYTKNVKEVSKKIKKLDARKQKLWTPICRYLNEYELVGFIADNKVEYNRAYYKLIELLLDNTIIEKTDFKLLSLAEAPGNFVKCVQNLRSKYVEDWNNFEIFTKLSDTDLVSQQDFIKEYGPNIFGLEKKGFTGDLTDISNIDEYIKINKDNKESRADLITADGGLGNKDYELEEYEHLPLFLGECIMAILNQKISGIFILKMYDVIDINTVNILYLLQAFYKNISIVKPYNSRPCNTEKYIYCEDFIGISDENYDTIKSNLYSILESVKNKNQKEYIYFNIFENFTYNEEFDNNIINFNNSIVLKTQSLYLETVFDILKVKNYYNKELIIKYFNKNTFNLQKIFEDSSEDLGYFIKSIEASIRLCKHMNVEIKPYFVEYHNSIKKMRACSMDDECNYYPSYYKEMYNINTEENEERKRTRITEFVKEYCISYDNNTDDNKIILFKLLQITDNFIRNKSITNINHIIINKIKDNINNQNRLVHLLIEICKITDIHKVFYTYNTSIVSIIQNFQNKIRSILGYYLCKFTYTPLYPKYVTLSEDIDRVKHYGVLYKSRYICFYSGDDLGIEEYDDIMASGVYRTNISIFEEEKTTSIDENVLSSINLNWNPLIDNIKYNICLFIMDEYKNLYPTFDLSDSIKINILKNMNKHQNFFDTSHKNILFDFDIIHKFLNNIYDTFYNSYNSNISLKNSSDKADNKKFKMKIHPTNTWLKKNNLLPILKSIKNSPNLTTIYSTFVSEINDRYVKIDEENNIEEDDITIPGYSKLKTDPNRLVGDLKILKDVILMYTIKSNIIKNYSSIIFYTLSLLSLFKNNFDIETTQDLANITTLTNDFYTIENKLTHKIYSSNDKIIEKIISDINQDYRKVITIPNSFSYETNIQNMEGFNKHLDEKWNNKLKGILKKDPELTKESNKKIFDEFYTKFRNQKIYVVDLLNDVTILKTSNLISLDLYNEIKEIDNKTLTKTILKNIQNFNETSYFYVTHNITNNFKSSFSYLADFEYFDENINIVNSIQETRKEFTDSSNKTLLSYNNNYILKPQFNKEEQTITNVSSKNLLETAIQYLLLHIYEPTDINQQDTSELAGISRLFNYNKELYDNYNDDTLYCTYTGLSKTQILNNILKNTPEEIMGIYNNLITNSNTLINNTHYIGMNYNINKNEKIFGFSSLLNNLIYKISKYESSLLYSFINLFIKSNDEYLNDSDLKNILINYNSNPVHYSIIFLKNSNYIDLFKTFLESSDDLITMSEKYNIQNIITKILVLNDDNLMNIYELYNNNDISSINNKLNNDITKLQNDILPMLPNFKLLENKSITSRNLILLINNIKKILSNLINLPNTNNKTMLKNKYKFLKKYYALPEFNKLIDIINNNDLFSSILFEKDNIVNYQIVFTKILQDFEYNFNNIYCSNEELSLKIIYYKLLYIINNCINKLTSYEYSIDKKYKLYWDYKNNKINNIEEEYNKSIDTIPDNIIVDNTTDDTYLQIFIQMINTCHNDLNVYVENFDEYYDTIDFNNENDTHNNGGADHMYSNMGSFNEELLGDIEED